MRVKGLEPPRLSSLDPKSSAATNYATHANPSAKVRIISELPNFIAFFFKKNVFLLVLCRGLQHCLTCDYENISFLTGVLFV